MCTLHSESYQLHFELMIFSIAPKIAGLMNSARGSIAPREDRSKVRTFLGKYFLADACSRDPNCGKAFEAAQDDYLLGISHGCGARNPEGVIVPQAPSALPVCL